MTTVSKTENFRQELSKLADIQEKIALGSATFDNDTKQAMCNLSKWTHDILQSDKKLTRRQLSSLSNELLIFWNETIGPDTELFWHELQNHSLHFDRKHPLKFALQKGWFQQVEQSIGAKNYWNQLRSTKFITNLYSADEIKIIDQLIIDDEQNRLNILKKCLDKKRIPHTQYLKFGECWAYFAQCNLFDKYFSKQQVDELKQIWQDFKST